MVTTRKGSADAPDEPGGDTKTSGFSEEQRGEIAALVAELIKGDKPPPSAPERPTVTDSQWDEMTDRKRESFVRDMVVSVLDDLAKQDDEARLRDDVEKLLKADKTPEPEAPPSVVTRLQRWLWGDEKK